MKIKAISEKEIDTVNYLMQLPGDGFKKAIKGYCETYQLSFDFVKEFSNHITTEMFSNSPKLKYELVEAFPELFDLNIWKNNKKKSFEIFKSEKFRNNFTKEELNTYIKEGNPYELSEDVFNDIFPFTEPETKKLLLSLYKGDLSKEFLLRNIEYFSDDVLKNENITKKLDKDDLEKLIKKNKALTMKFLVNALVVRNDIAWQERICDEALDGKISIQESGGTFDSDLKYAISRMHEDVLIKLFKLLIKYDNNAITYTALEYLLRVKEPNEELCLVLLLNFKGNNLVTALANYAKEKGYSSLLVGLFL